MPLWDRHLSVILPVWALQTQDADTSWQNTCQKRACVCCEGWFPGEMRHFHWTERAAPPLHTSRPGECNFILNGSRRKTVYFCLWDSSACKIDGWWQRALELMWSSTVVNDGCPWHLPCRHGQCWAADSFAARRQGHADSRGAGSMCWSSRINN